MQLQQLITRLISALGMMSPFGMVLGALFVPFFVAVAVETALGVGFVPTSILAGVLWLLATIGLGLRFGTWRALFLALVPGGLSTALFLLLQFSRVLGKVEGPLAFAWAIIALIWLVGIAVGVLMRKAVYRRSQSFS